MILEKIKKHCELKKFARITRSVSEDSTLISRGYILAYSANFVLIQETGDFTLDGYIVLPVSQIQKIRYNKNDKYYHKIMVAEGEVEKSGISYSVNLSTWQKIFDSIKQRQLNVIVECEQSDINSFNIGPIIKTTKKKVYIQYFDATGFFEGKPTVIDFEKITKVVFDDRYTNIFSKYLRHRKNKE